MRNLGTRNSPLVQGHLRGVAVLWNGLSAFVNLAVCKRNHPEAVMEEIGKLMLDEQQAARLSVSTSAHWRLKRHESRFPMDAGLSAVL
jgi:hypothetical protein